MHRIKIINVAIAALACALIPHVAAGPYTPDPTWPTSIPKGASQFSAMALDTSTEEGLIYVAQRSLGYPNPILAFSKEGDFKFAWGNKSISNTGSSWGVHGMMYYPQGNGSLFITDTGDHTVKQ